MSSPDDQKPDRPVALRVVGVVDYAGAFEKRVDVKSPIAQLRRRIGSGRHGRHYSGLKPDPGVRQSC